MVGRYFRWYLLARDDVEDEVDTYASCEALLLRARLKIHDQALWFYYFTSQSFMYSYVTSTLDPDAAFRQQVAAHTVNLCDQACAWHRWWVSPSQSPIRWRSRRNSRSFDKFLSCSYLPLRSINFTYAVSLPQCLSLLSTDCTPGSSSLVSLSVWLYITVLPADRA